MNQNLMQSGQAVGSYRPATPVVADNPKRGWGHALASLTLAVTGWQAAPASATELTFDPSALGLGGSAITFDTLYGGEISVLSYAHLPDGSLYWYEDGYISIGAASLYGAPVDTSSLNSDYSLYVHFTLDGTGAGENASGTIELIAAEGATNFTVDYTGAWPVVAAYALNSGATYTVASVDLLTWDAGISSTGSLWTLLTAALQNGSTGALSSTATATLVNGVFDHPDTSYVTDMTTGTTVIWGGTDVLTFSSAVPEPASWALMGAGALVGGLSLRRRRRQD